MYVCMCEGKWVFLWVVVCGGENGRCAVRLRWARDVVVSGAGVALSAVPRRAAG